MGSRKAPILILITLLALSTVMCNFANRPSQPLETPMINGSISGKLSFPSESIPPLRVTAFNLSTGEARYIDTQVNQMTYRLENLPPGTYHVVAYQENGLAGGYSQAVPCGLSVDCTDHSLIDVMVQPGKDTPGIDPGDWYAPQGAFPGMPSR